MLDNETGLNAQVPIVEKVLRATGLHVLRPAKTSIRVVLPAPDVPIKATSTPGLQQRCQSRLTFMHHGQNI